MEINPLSPTAALIAAIRGETARGRKTASHSGVTNRTSEGTRTRQANSTAQLERQLAQIASEVTGNDLAAVRRARPLLIRQVLLWEFGRAFREHPEWTPITQRIEAALDTADPGGHAFLGLLRSLQRKS
ncbi:hypothetical protein [Xanthomonas prunicola]|jgi:hypothetical protein|uniref:Uncharacterized protein n=1 Tax=Xanthomonas prunicola TaxID=2053930 RepID=A0A2N3REZ7_9XANT|nr:hypothetical protein [Xanthomonas prunicola]PKV11041.1 hypothetical protein XpruCFBP8353_19755 [Xanthomonas prunicola]PKV15312.1 hypothetical protein XpruCFBP8354_20515 [Xanthomonas prunicola]PKV19498.1 hypothetical protein CVO74_21030 [Xanthomonas prunicola]